VGGERNKSLRNLNYNDSMHGPKEQILQGVLAQGGSEVQKGTEATKRYSRRGLNLCGFRRQRGQGEGTQSFIKRKMRPGFCDQQGKGAKLGDGREKEGNEDFLCGTAISRTGLIIRSN